jgi:ABC-type sugar transport system permease subunit
MLTVATPTSPAPTKSPQRRWLTGESITALLFILPSLIGFTIFYAVPAVRGLWISFTNWDLLRPAKFIGIENYVKLSGQRFLECDAGDALLRAVEHPAADRTGDDHRRDDVGSPSRW